VLVGLLKWTVPVLPLGATVGFLARLSVAGLGSAVAALAAAHYGAGPISSVATPLSRVVHFLDAARIGHVLEVILVTFAGFGVFLALSLALRLQEPWECWHWTQEKFAQEEFEVG